MNISGVTATAQMLPQMPEEAYSGTDGEMAGSGPVALSMQISTQVMDMAQKQFEQAASELISIMAAATGVGGNIDLSV